MTPDQVRETMTASDLCEWAVYLNSPFSARGREVLMNGWLAHIIRSIVADKRHRPKFTDSMFPFDKLSKDFFASATTATVAVDGKKKSGRRGPTTVGEAEHMGQIVRKRFEKALADFRAGRTTNRFGLKVHEIMKS